MTLETFLLVFAIGIASYRITRFFLFDTLIDGLRQKWYVWLINRNNKVANKILDLSSCSWCLGVHISWAIYSLWLHVWPWKLGVQNWILVAVIAGIQGYLHAIEPGEDEGHEH